MASSPRRPSVDQGPRSRFVEGSMHDRVSRKPPAEFLGPDMAASIERQFYSGEEWIMMNQDSVANAAENRHELKHRPYSAQALLQDTCTHEQEHQRQYLAKRPAHKKSASFIERVRGAFGFGLGFGRKEKSVVQQEAAKRISYQQPPVTPPLSALERHRGVVKSMSQPNIDYASSTGDLVGLGLPCHSSNGAGHPPSREEIMKSYNQLLESGFFKAHAIQSTRQPLPGRGPSFRAREQRRATPTLPTIPSPRREPPPPPSPEKVLEAAAAAAATTTSTTSPNIKPPSPTRKPPLIPPLTQDLKSTLYGTRRSFPLTSPGSSNLETRPSSESLRYPLRGRKRARAETETEENSAASSRQQSPAPTRKSPRKLRKVHGTTAWSGAPSSLTSDGVIRTSIDSTRMVEKSGVDSESGGNSTTHPRPGSSSPAKLQKRINARPRSRSPYAAATSSSCPPISMYNTHNHSPRSRSRSRSRSRLRAGRDRSPSHSAHHADANNYIYTDHIAMHIDPREPQVPSSPKERGEAQAASMPLPLSVVPDANRGIPSVPRIPPELLGLRLGVSKFSDTKNKNSSRQAVQGDENAEMEWEAELLLPHAM